MKIQFLPNSAERIFNQGKTILEMADEAGVAIDGNCGGNGTCGKCKIKVLAGNDGKLSKEEKSILTDSEIREGYRLACSFRPMNDVTVETPLEEGAVERKTMLSGILSGFAVKSNLRKVFIQIEKSTIVSQTADFEKIKTQCGLDGQVGICAELMQRLPDILSESHDVTVTIYENMIADIESYDTSAHCYGLAIDIGTTTVVGHLWNLITGELIGVSAVSNPQGLYGADVISRITYASESKENMDNIHQKIISCINGIAINFSETYHVKLDHIYYITIVGNTTMSHLFLGVSPRQLAVAPYHPVFVNSMTGSALELGISINKNAKYYLLPNIAGHVGSDINAGVISTGILHEDGIHLLIDVGTNGEIVLTGKGIAMACSTAAGPAFEGATIFKGMRAAEGAIEKVRINDDVHIKVIGNAAPRGICGSGIIDTVAQLIVSGLIDRTGKFIEAEDDEEKSIPEAILRRLRRGERGVEFVLAFGQGGEDVVILQKDIREVQLAKAAIYAGIRTMMGRMCITDDDLDRIHIAGAFGNYLDIDSALTIGMLPQIDKDKIISEGNSAGIGACMALLSANMREEAERTAKTIEHVELGACLEFQNEYMKALGF